MAKTQIIESFITNGQILEQESVNDAILCRAKYQICSVGEKNRNNRVYEKAVWDKVLADPEISEKLKNRALFFHAEHPTTTQSNTEKVAGVVTDIKLNEKENKVYAVMEVLDTPYGRIVDTLLRAGCGIGVSTRADGELEEALDEAGGKYQRVVPESYRFVTIDFTADPSTFGSELPIAVERDVTKVISNGLDDSKLDRDFATVLLETMHSPEAVALLESIKNDKHHDGCECKASDKKCTKGCTHAVEEKYTTSADKSGQPANAGAASKVAKKSAAKNKVKLGEQEVQSCPKCGKAFNALRQGSNPHRCKDTYATAEGVQVDGMHTGEKATNFLIDNWDKFIDHADAVRNLITVFKMGEDDAKQVVDSLEQSRGKISAVGAMSNEKALPSDISLKLDEMSKRLVSLTAERNQLVDNYGKDAMAFTITIEGLKEQLKTVQLEAKKSEGLIQSHVGTIATLKEKLEKSNEDKRILEETHKQDIKRIQEERSAEAKRTTEDRQREITELRESHRRDLIKFYVGAKTKGMGLSLSESVLTLLESCKTVEEVDALIRKTQNALRETLVQSAGIVSEIIVESQSDPNPVMADIRNKVASVLKHIGI